MGTRRKFAHRRVAVRELTGRYRELPNLLVIGGHRCGTSSLYKYLGGHPQVSSSVRKEVDFFTLYYGRGVDWYRAHFPLKRIIERARPRVLFEATPNYIFDPRCAERASRLLPEARIILLLRDPVERAFSHYEHNRRRNLDPLTFEAAIEREEERIGPARAALEADPSIPLPRELTRYSYASRGLYAEQLKVWFAHFPRERVRVVSSEAFYRETGAVFNSLTSFLGIREWLPASFENHSYRRDAGSGNKMPFPGHVRAALVERFSEPNRQLYQLLGEDFGWSRPVDASSVHPITPEISL